jgi:hypothetical protein
MFLPGGTNYGRLFTWRVLTMDHRTMIVSYAELIIRRTKAARLEHFNVDTFQTNTKDGTSLW